MTLIWREAEKDDRVLLRRFTCTDPAPKAPGKRPEPHPRKWELAVQKAIHSLPVPLRGADGVALLGFDGDQLVAVVVWCRMIDQETFYKLQLLAVSSDCRTRGGTEVGDVAREAFNQALTRIRKECSTATAFGLVDRRNRASQRVLEAAKFARSPGFPVEDPDLEAWIASIADALDHLAAN